ncbi:MAG TPA: hypothetical protein VF719_09310, partial [Abditibacteriaceae bacterium]
MLFCIVGSWRPLGGGYDFWAHAAVGRWIANHRQIPSEGLFIWSAPDTPWVAHSWLSQLFFYFLLHFTSPFGVMLFNTGMVCLVFFLIWKLWQGRGGTSILVALIFALGIWVSSPRFHPRQELLTALILVMLLKFLVQWRTTDAPKPRVALTACCLVLLFALWINLHALVALGLILVVVTAASDALQYRFDRRTQILIGMAVLCLLATVLNPWGIGYWAAANVLKSGSQAASVDEWKPFWKTPTLAMKYVYAEGALLLLCLFAWLRNDRRRWAEILWLLLTALMFVKARRMLWLLAIVCLVVMAANARSFETETLWRSWKKLTRQPLGEHIPPLFRMTAQAGGVGILLIWIASIGSIFRTESPEYWPPRGIDLQAPVQAAAFIDRQKYPGRVFNDYETS